MRPLLAILLLSLLASPALSQVDPGPDGVGVYFDQAATQTWRAAAPFQPVTAYVAITHASSASGIGEVEVEIGITGPALLLSRTYPCPGIFIFEEWPCVRFGCFSPLPAASAVVILSQDLMVTTAGGVVEFRLRPCTPSTLPGSPGWVPGDDPVDVRPLHVSSGSFDLPVARINGEPVVPLAEGSWGAVKGLYR